MDSCYAFSQYDVRVASDAGRREQDDTGPAKEAIRTASRHRRCLEPGIAQREGLRALLVLGVVVRIVIVHVDSECLDVVPQHILERATR